MVLSLHQSHRSELILRKPYSVAYVQHIYVCGISGAISLYLKPKHACTVLEAPKDTSTVRAVLHYLKPKC